MSTFSLSSFPRFTCQLFTFLDKCNNGKFETWKSQKGKSGKRFVLHVYIVGLVLFCFWVSCIVVLVFLFFILVACVCLKGEVLCSFSYFGGVVVGVWFF